MSDISATSLAAAGDKLRVGSVLSKSLEIYLRNFPKCFAVGAVMGLPSLVSAIYLYEIAGSRQPIPAVSFSSTRWASCYCGSSYSPSVSRR